MFKFLKMGRGKQVPEGHLADESTPSQSHPSVSASSQQHATTSRDLARVVLRDTLRMNGIPSDWISCESGPRTDDSIDGSLLIQLVIDRWHEGLPAYAPLLQLQFLQGLQRFDPASDHSQHVVVWKFSPTCGYPRTAMPAPDFWSDKPAVPAKPKFDLPASNRDKLDDDFVPTVPDEFR
jgi:hypothetical protein